MNRSTAGASVAPHWPPIALLALAPPLLLALLAARERGGMEPQSQRPVAKVLSRPDLVLEILRHLPTADRARAGLVCQVFAAASRDDALWRSSLPEWWAAALEEELGRDARAWRNSALALHLHFPAALTLEPLKMARRAASGPADAEEDSERDEDALRDEKASRILNSVWCLASVSPSAWWHDLILSKTLHEFEQERAAGGGTPRRPLPRRSAETQEHAEDDPNGPMPRSGSATPYHWHGMVHFHLARATWRRGQWRRALRHFQVAVATCPRESEVLAGLGVFLCSCPVPGGASGCNLLTASSGAAEVDKRQEQDESQHRETHQNLPRRYDLVTARESIELALQCESGLGWVFSEVGEERLELVMSQLEGEDAFSPATAKTSDQDWRDDEIDAKQRNHGNAKGSHGIAVLARDWLPARWETNRPPWERQLIRKFNLERDTHFQRSSGSTAAALPRLDETTALEAAADGAGQHAGMMTPQFAAAAAGHGGIFAPEMARELVGRSWVRVDQYDVIEALSVACCVFSVEGEQTGLSSSIGNLSVALRCSGDTSWALRAAHKALGLMAQQRQHQHEQPQLQQQRRGTGDEANPDEHDSSDDVEVNPEEQDSSDDDGGSTTSDATAGDNGVNDSSSTALSLQFACAVVYAERAHQAHNTLMLLSKDYPLTGEVICPEAVDLPTCSEDTAQIRHEYKEQHAEGQRHIAALLRHFTAEACGTVSRAASDGHAAVSAPAAAVGAAATDQHEHELNWQDREVLQDPTVHGGRAMLWTERHRSSLAQMNHYFAQAMQTSKQLSADDVWQHIPPGLGVEAGERAEQASVGKKERERAVVCEWIHSLCDAGQIVDAKRKLKDLWSLLEGPLKEAHQVLVANEDPDGLHTIENSSEAVLQQTVAAEMTTDGGPVVPLPKTHEPARWMAACQVDGGQSSSRPKDSMIPSFSCSGNNKRDAAHNRWRGIDRDTLELLEEEMSYLLLKAKLDEATPWPLSMMMTAADVDGSGAVQEPIRPSSSLAAADGYERAVNLAERIARHGPMVQCLKRPIPPGCFENIRGRLRPVMHASESKPGNSSVLATGDDLRHVLETCLFRARIGPQARAFRELSRSHLSLYNPTAAMASVQQCLQLVSPPFELMKADSSHRSTDEDTGGKQPLVQLGPPVETTLSRLSVFECADKRTKKQPNGTLAVNSIRSMMDMRVLGAGSTISVALEDDDEDACARRQQLFDICAGAIAESHTLAAQLSQRSCDYDMCEQYCAAALEIAPRLPARNRRWVEMLAVGTRGDSALTRADWNAALAAYRSALEIASSIGESLAAAAAELQLAEVERRRENSTNINACRVRAKVAGQNAARSGAGALRTVAAALRTSASASIMAEQYETARRQLQACFQLILKESPPWWSGQSSAWHVLGTLCAATGERTAAVSHWRRGLVLAVRASDPMLTAVHTRDVLMHTTDSASAGNIHLNAVEREQLLTSGLAAAKKVSDPTLVKTFMDLRRRLTI